MTHPNTKVIAVDVGIRGAISFSGPPITAKPLPIAGGEIDLAALASWIREFDPQLAIVEKVASRPGQGVRSVFSFGKTYGSILGVLAALQIPTELVTPQRWKRSILAGTKRDKASSVEYCRRKFPEVPLIMPGCRKCHDGIADALCLLEFGLREFCNYREEPALARTATAP